MKFGPRPVRQAKGAVLAHSLHVEGGRLRKGRVLSAEDIDLLHSAGIAEVVVAVSAPGDVAEDAAAAELGAALLAGGDKGLLAEDPFTGRVNLRSSGPGVLQVDAGAVARINAVDPSITLATLPEWQRVEPGMMVATVKMIPYAVPGTKLRAAVAEAQGALRLVPPALSSAGLVLTQLPGLQLNDDKAISVTKARLEAMGVVLAGVESVAHRSEDLAQAICDVPGELVLILTASATSDEADVGPAALIAAGGRLTRFGMPVDPGNLLFLGDQGGRPVIGLPGCARAPALNGADWVMERVICGVPPSAEDIAAMGVGGLLKEIPTRPQPRARKRGARDLAAP